MDNLRVQVDMYGSSVLLRTSYMHHYACMHPDTHTYSQGCRFPHAHTEQPHANAWVSEVIGGSRQEVEKDGGEKNESTSILRPSTIVPFSFSRARSASVLVSKVTNPKP